MKISIMAHGHTHSWESKHDGQDIDEVIEQLKGLLVSVGYHPTIVDEKFAFDTYPWFPDKEKKARSIEDEVAICDAPKEHLIKPEDFEEIPTKE